MNDVKGEEVNLETMCDGVRELENFMHAQWDAQEADKKRWDAFRRFVEEVVLTCWRCDSDFFR